MIVSIEPSVSLAAKIVNLPEGTLFRRLSSGMVYLRFFRGVVCLDGSVSWADRDLADFPSWLIEVLPAGTIVTLKVE